MIRLYKITLFADEEMGFNYDTERENKHEATSIDTGRIEKDRGRIGQVSHTALTGVLQGEGLSPEQAPKAVRGAVRGK